MIRSFFSSILSRAVVSPLLRPGAGRYAALYFSAVALPLLGQMQPYGRFEGEMLPIVEYNDNYLEVLKNGHEHRTWDMSCEIRPARAFAEGFIEIRDVKVDLDPLQNRPPAARAKPDAIRFRYTANLVADRSLSDCFALLSFITEGSVGTRLIQIGRLTSGKAKALEVELRFRVDSVCTLHIFSKALEVRSTLHKEAYDVASDYAAFQKQVKGLSAAELLDSAEEYAHALSADGRLLAALRQRDARKLIFIYDLEAMKLLCETPVAETGYDVRDLNWISNHELAYIAEEKFADYSWKPKLRLLDTTTGKTKVLLDHADTIVLALPDNPDVLLILDERWTFKFNVRTGKSYDLEELESGYFRFDRSGNSRVMVRYDRDKVLYYVRPTGDSRWRELDDVVKEPGLKFNTRGAQLLDRVVDIHSIGPDGDILYVSTRLGDADRFQLAAYSMSEGTIKHVIAKHPRFDLTTSDFGRTRLLFEKDSSRLLGIIYEAQKPQVVWLDPDYAAVQKSMDASFPQNFNQPIDWSKDGKTFIYLSTGVQNPGTFYVFKPQTGRLIPLLELGERLKGRTLAKTEPFEFTARDGQVIPGYITRPPNPDSGLPPLIVSVHGGPMARDSWEYDPENQFFASRGYVVLQVNYRGSSGYGAAYQKAGLRARLDTVILDDIADGARHLIETKEVDPKRVAIMGSSFGGWATYMSLIKYPELYQVGVATSAIANWRKALEDDRWHFNNRLAFTFWKSLLSRESFADDEKFIDPYLRASDIKQPLFIIHGGRDDVVSSREAGMMLDAVKKHNPNVQSHLFPHATHTYWTFEDRVVRLNEIAAFFSQYLGKAASGNSSAQDVASGAPH